MQGEIVPYEPQPVAAADELPTLTDKQAAFVAAYLESRLDPIAAGMAIGLTRASARASAYKYVNHPAIRAHVERHLDALIVSNTAILAELVNIAMAPTQHFMQVLQSEYTDEKGRTHPAIIRLDYSAKTKALELLMRAKGMLSQVDVNVNVTTRTIVGIDLDRMRDG